MIPQPPGAPDSDDRSAAAPIFDGVVLAGGQGRRMGTADKTAIEVGGRRMVDVAVSALAAARRVVVVGPGADVVEQPPGAGPLAAMAAGLGLVEAPVVAVLAADLPFVTAEAVAVLVRRAPAVAVDDAGRDQYLLAAYPTALLRSALPARPAGGRLREVVSRLAPERVELAGWPPPWWDCDTAAELAQARVWWETRPE